MIAAFLWCNLYLLLASRLQFYRSELENNFTLKAYWNEVVSVNFNKR